MLWIGLHLPRLPLELFTRGGAAPEPFAVCDAAREPRVLIANPAAQCHGVRAGMKLSAAHVLVKNLRARTRDEAAERETLERLGAWAGQFTSLVSLAPPQLLLLEVEGSLALFRGLGPLLARVRSGIEALGYHATFAVAPTPLAAAWLARAGAGAAVTDSARLASALAPLPVGDAGFPPRALELLENLGARCLGDCLRLPRDGLARRLGAETVLMLDRALGRVPDPRPPYTAPETFEAQLPLPDAVASTEGILFPLNRLVLELCGFLAARLAGAQEIVLTLRHPRAAATPVPLSIVAPTREAKHLLDLFREHLARLALPEPVEAIALRVPRLATLRAQPLDLFDPRRSSAEPGTTLIERLRARLGREAVRGLCQAAEHRPEYAWRYAEPGEAGANAGFGRRPLWLLPEPLPLAMRNDEPFLDGTLRLEPGRERIESGWWDGGDVARDYFIARNTEGAQLWIFRELGGERRWFLHGIFG